MISNWKWSLTFTILWVAVSLATNQWESKPTGINACISKQTCHDCIQTPSCAWCSKADFSDKRCFLPHVNTKISEECPANDTINPDNVFIVIRNKELWKGSYTINPGYEEGLIVDQGGYHTSSGNFHSEGHQASSGNYHGEQSGSSSFSENKEEAVQLSPQEITLKLRINEAQKIKIRFAQSEDYPVDLYYLMDLSNSMKDDKQKLSSLGSLLVESMSNITSNFRLGFGSFVDKVVMPYVSIAPKALQEPCDGCAAPYGYRNHMPLSQNTRKFVDEVYAAPVSGNLDAPEGGFDAIMQAIVCRDQIQWRERARKLLLFSTDAGFHFAGDGKLSGIVKPNDGCCHLDNTGLYTHSDVQDYPSISQINLKVKENSVNIIWAVTEEQIKIYQALTKHVEGSYAAQLSNDSSNIVELVREQYNQISSTIELKDTAGSYVNIKYYSSCLGNQKVETNKCDGIKVGNQVEFTAEFTVPACPKDRSEWKQKFFIYPVGINESVTVNLEMICDCNCENEGDGFVPWSPICSHHGDLSCGVCKCHDGFFGKNCECGINDKNLTQINEFACRYNNATQDCSGRGVCECNQCNCNIRDSVEEKIWGDYCECDNFSCDRKDSVLCAGHGECNCGICQCNDGWTGKDCSCSTSTTNCMFNNVVCAGHGECVCGRCECENPPNNNATIYKGNFCQTCIGCDTKCVSLEDCIRCLEIDGHNVNRDKCNASCLPYEIEIVEQLIINLDETNAVECSGFDQEDCRFNYVYTENGTDRIYITLQRQRACPPHVYVLGIVLAVIMAVVMVGLAFLLTWKLFTTIHDRREFARFEKERMMAKWDASENPIYRQATSTFKNPTYTASSGHMHMRR